MNYWAIWDEPTPLQMPCEHKFLKDLDLSYVTDMGYEPTTLILGTFNPSWPETNQAKWFYGRTHDGNGNLSNRFWHVLPVLYGEGSLMNAGVDEWKAFCKRRRIAITDMIRRIEDADADIPEHRKFLGSYSDSSIAKHFKCHCENDLDGLLKAFPSIRHVYMTLMTTGGLWQRLTHGIKTTCESTGRTHQDLLTPSRFARFQRGRWNRSHPLDPVTTIEELLEKRWREAWHAKY